MSGRPERAFEDEDWFRQLGTGLLHALSDPGLFDEELKPKPFRFGFGVDAPVRNTPRRTRHRGSVPRRTTD